MDSSVRRHFRLLLMLLSCEHCPVLIFFPKWKKTERRLYIFSVKTFYLCSFSTVNKNWPYEILQIIAFCFYLNSTVCQLFGNLNCTETCEIQWFKLSKGFCLILESSLSHSLSTASSSLMILVQSLHHSRGSFMLLRFLIWWSWYLGLSLWLLQWGCQ